MRTGILILILFLSSCDTGNNEVNDFISSAFTLKQGNKNGSTYFYPVIKDEINRHSEYGHLVNENMFMMKYLLWNLIDLEMAPEVRYSYHSLDKTIKKFHAQVSSNKNITDNIKKLLKTEQADYYLIPLDSLVSIASKLFFAKYLGDGRIQWSICSGKSVFPELYSKRKHVESVILQAFCYQAIYKSETINGTNLFGIFDKYIEEIRPLLYDADPSNLEEIANGEMWVRMASATLLREALCNEYEEQKARLFFELEEM